MQDTSISEITGDEVLPLEEPLYMQRKDSAHSSVRNTPRAGLESDKSMIEVSAAK